MWKRKWGFKYKLIIIVATVVLLLTYIQYSEYETIELCTVVNERFRTAHQLLENTKHFPKEFLAVRIGQPNCLESYEYGVELEAVYHEVDVVMTK